ncbi:unnamed protein product [Gulo gulo]|uniref:Uncharacterized protein n=1 Tax=Gulo gulo TaxID=48420 RepID=A0A9X9LJL1_GULGU|nr:unnamed protein product [Gulo gulo]
MERRRHMFHSAGS